jgi:hypothetical protein
MGICMWVGFMDYAGHALASWAVPVVYTGLGGARSRTRPRYAILPALSRWRAGAASLAKIAGGAAGQAGFRNAVRVMASASSRCR